MDSLPIIDLELGLNDVKHQELEQNLKKKQNKYINIDFNFNFYTSINHFSNKTNKEINSKLFKLMKKAAFIILDDINIVEYYVYEKRYIEGEADFLIKNKSYLYSRATWFSVEAYVPLTKSIYNFSAARIIVGISNYYLGSRQG